MLHYASIGASGPIPAAIVLDASDRRPFQRKAAQGEAEQQLHWPPNRAQL